MYRRLLPALLFIPALFGFGSITQAQSAFEGTGVGPIPDSTSSTGCQFPGAARDVLFNVSGVGGAPASVSVEISFDPSHGWGGDVVSTLISPDGTQFVLFGYTGISSAQGTFDGGDGSDLAGPYVFSDSATGNWWATADDTDDSLPIPSGSYRTSAIGGVGATGGATSLNSAFASIPTSNGTWILRFTDGCSTDSGTVSSAKLTLSPATPAVPQKPNVDMNGLGRSDFVVIRLENFPGSAAAGTRPALYGRDKLRRDLAYKRNGYPSNAVDPSFQWWTLFTDASGYSTGVVGNAILDWETPADFDGDNKVDIGVWRGGGSSTSERSFFWINSSTSTLGSAALGLAGDDPTVVGDYDGDNKADPAVFRCPETAGQCYFFYRGTNNNPQGNITYWPLGYGETGAVFPMAGDFDGDQKFDFCVFREKPGQPGQGQFVLQPSGALNTVEFIEYGLINTDFLIPASDFDGDGKTDFAVARAEGGHWNFYVLERDGGGNPSASVQFGLDSDIIAPGDYDGDGRTDFAIYRPAEDSGNSTFWVIRSSNSQVLVQPFGLGTDIPAAKWRIQ